MRIREPKTTALIFSSGKMVCTGARSEEDSKLAARKYCRIVQKLGYTDAKFKDFKIQNIVASSDVKFPIRLEGLAYSHGLFSSYEPEIFPGLIYRMKDPKVVLLIFVSGAPAARLALKAAFSACFACRSLTWQHVAHCANETLLQAKPCAATTDLHYVCMHVLTLAPLPASRGHCCGLKTAPAALCFTHPPASSHRACALFAFTRTCAQAYAALPRAPRPAQQARWC